MGATYQSDVVIVGGGLAGLAAAHDLLGYNKKVLLLDRDTSENFGGLARRAFGGIMLVDTPDQRKRGIRDSPELAWSDWQSYAEFGADDLLPQQWARFYVENSVSYIYEWLRGKGVSFLPLMNWPERGLFKPGNSVPRWHITWGTGYALVESVLRSLERHPHYQNLHVCFSHKVDRLVMQNGQVTAVAGILEDTGEEFLARGDAVIIASGGICGGDLSEVRKHWPVELGSPPAVLLNGSHRFADGLLYKVASENGARLTHLEKYWHYAAGIFHPFPKQESDGLSLVPPRSALWLDATGKRFGPIPLVGYTDTSYLVQEICRSPAQYSWQVLNWKIATKELAVSGSDYMTSIRQKKRLKLFKEIFFGNKELVSRLLGESQDFVAANSLAELADKMDGLSLAGFRIDREKMLGEIASYDAMIERGEAYFNDDQLRRIANFRAYRGDRLRVCKFQRINDPKAYPLIAIREFILSRKSLGGIMTDLKSRVINQAGHPIPGLYAVGESAGFGGGGINGKRSLEGTFLGSCVLTGRVAASAINGN